MAINQGTAKRITTLLKPLFGFDSYSACLFFSFVFSALIYIFPGIYFEELTDLFLKSHQLFLTIMGVCSGVLTVFI